MSHPGGRPPKDPDALRVVFARVRMTAAEAATIAQNATAADRTLSAYLREAGLQAQFRVVPAINHTAWEQLSRLAANFNQAIHLANTGAPIAISDAELREAISLLRYLRQELRGD